MRELLNRGLLPPLSKKMRQANERDSEGARSPTRGKKAYEDEGRGSEGVRELLSVESQPAEE